MSVRYGWDDSQIIRPFQLAGIRAQLEGVDTVVQAPMGSGKTVIAAGPHASPRSEGMITLLSVPLIQWAEDMVTTFREELKLNTIAIHSANGALSPLVIKDILALKYQVVIASPEMLQSRTFINRLLRNPSFSQRIISFVVDEAHCVSLWGADFRKKYGSLGIVRAFLPRGTPVIAMTATLTGRVRRDICSKLHFAKHASQSRNEGNDRPNVSIVVRACEHPLVSFADLDFIIPTTIRCHTDLPKTYLYVDDVNTGSQIVDHLSSLLKSRNTRILVCTDAAGMGINIPDVDVVVQWKLPSTLSSFIQRAGGAARVEPSAYKVDIVTTPEASTTKRRRRTKKVKPGEGAGTVPTIGQRTRAQEAALKAYAIAHGVARGSSKLEDAPPAGAQPQFSPDRDDEGLLVFCRRKVWAEVFENDPNTLELCTSGIACCDICVPTLFNRTRPGKYAAPKKTGSLKKGLPDIATVRKLMAWRTSIYKVHHTYSLLCPSAILGDSLLLDLASCGPIGADKIRQVLQPGGKFMEGNYRATEIHRFVFENEDVYAIEADPM
ncbi:P-loop containing nucleoside triphosphate hydrolase protein [Irpex lacteus]|nr:P-loop containing nucleoside triphosphate hydrolase protein [Irpex lacteus]